MDKKKEVKRIFDSIAKRYDLLNHLLSFGIDYYWRKKAFDLTKLNSSTILLDVACGTGDFSQEAHRRGIGNIYTADFSFEMLRMLGQKFSWGKNCRVQCVAEALPYKDNSFTNISVAFGVRNFHNIHQGFNEFFRVLDKDGVVTVLEFCLPQNKLVRWGYMFYFKKVLPFVGNLISGDKSAYTYLPESVEEFDMKVDLIKELSESGFSNVVRNNLTFGIVQVVRGVKR